MKKLFSLPCLCPTKRVERSRGEAGHTLWASFRINFALLFDIARLLRSRAHLAKKIQQISSFYKRAILSNCEVYRAVVFHFTLVKFVENDVKVLYHSVLEATHI